MLSSLLPAVLAGVSLLPAPTGASLWPAPDAMTNGTSFLRLSNSFTITMSSALSSSAVAGSLKNSIAIAEAQLKTDDLERLVPGRGAADAAAVQAAKVLTSLTLSLDSSGSTKGESSLMSIEQEVDQPLEDWDEAYTLTIPLGGEATLTAASSLGLLRGLQSFTLFWYVMPGDESVKYAVDMPVKIEDKPAFRWRGFLLDTSRHYFPVKAIKRTLEAMSYTKLNVFNWHITDSQSWPLYIPAYPEISAKGAYGPKKVYTSDDFKEVQDYGRSLGITTVVEIDTPGHTGSIYDSYPDYVACYAESPWTTYANEPPAGQVRFPVPKVQTFMNKLIGSVLPEVDSQYWSTGGDELNVQCYTDDAETQAALKARNLTLEEALTDFVLSTHKTVHKAGKTPVVWEEMALAHEVGNKLSNDTVVIVWISSADAKAVAEMGLRIVHAPSNYFYLDCGAGEWIGKDPGANSWCDPFKSWQYIYQFNPFANLTSEQHSLVLGGESALWTEQSDHTNLDPITWPRAASAAEVFWTGAKLPGGEKRNVGEAIARLHDWRYRVVQRGIHAIPLQPEWCALRPDQCNLDS